VSLDCGHGAREVAWAKLGVFDEIVGWDLSPARIERAAQRAEEEGVADVLRFEVGDVSKPLTGSERYDVIICEQSLHHFSPLDSILDEIDGALADDGLFVIDEFVGATRYQWPTRQIDAVNQLLDLFPRRFHVEWDGVRIKESHFRPSKLRMILLDPSEAVESSRILPTLDEKFDVAERRDYGGGRLQFALSGIAHHFLGDDDDAPQLLQACFDREDALLASGEVGSDYSAVVYRKRQRG
jgi:SAM-dependent methyltransferase